MLIQTNSQLKVFSERLAHERLIALDMEFVSEGRYFAAPGTLQVATGNEHVLIDLVALPDISLVKPVLLEPEVTKVLHAGRNDLEILYRLLGAPVPNIYDTQIVAALLGYGEQISLHTLLKVTLGLSLRKEHSFSDWLRRPLNPEQVEYALNDVRHLISIHDFLNRELRQKGRAEWVREECRPLEDEERYRPPDEREVYRTIKGAESLNQTQLNLVQEITAWRELKARELNIPARKIAADQALIELARRPRKTVRQLAEVRGLNNGFVERYGQEIIRAIERGTTNHAPPLAGYESFPQEVEATVDFLTLCLRCIARENSISPGTVANRAALRELVREGETAEVPLLRGWRRDLAGNALLRARDGRASVTVSAQTKEVTVSLTPAV